MTVCCCICYFYFLYFRRFNLKILAAIPLILIMSEHNKFMLS